MNDNSNLEKREVPVEQAERIRSGETYIPAVDIVEQGDELLLMADMPGARAEDIDIQYERGRLTVSARIAARQDGDTEWALREYGVGDFERSFQVGDGIDAGRIAAEVDAGVLTLHLPKAEAARTRKIEVKVGG